MYVTGSSPRVWGQGSPYYFFSYLSRIIPTRVGTSTGKTIDLNTLKDHPHACGDKSVFKNNHVCLLGSSPRVWGQGNCKKVRIQKRRIIPTRVGTSLCARETRLYPWDHPHACGDKISGRLPLISTLGSSPRVWGQVALTAYLTLGTRIIPTRVGTSTGSGGVFS